MTGKSHEFIVIGGGIVGAAIADGLARRGSDVAILDEGDVAIRAARGNLGNVWVQGKGAGYPAYADVTRQAALDWQALASRLQNETGIDVHFQNPGAVFLCFSDEELERRSAVMARSLLDTRIDNPYTMLDQNALTQIIPQIGPSVVGGSHTLMDGTANPIYLLRALIKSVVLHGGQYLANHGVTEVSAQEGGFVLHTPSGEMQAGHIVFCAGLGNARLAPQLEMFGDVRPVRGQIMVTERLQPFLNLGTNFVRQTVEGSCVIGESSEEVGFDTGTTMRILNGTAAKAIRAFPILKHAQIVRTWGALRIMTPDGIPVYQMKGFGKGAAHRATVVSVHSGVTLAPYHCEGLAEQIAKGTLAPEIAQSFSAERFNVSTH